MDLADRVYEVTAGFPKHELYGLTSQLRRAAVSVPSNIAEGQARFSGRDFRHFLRHCRGSLAELHTQIIIARRRDYLSQDESDSLALRIAEVNRIIAGLIGSIDLDR